MHFVEESETDPESALSSFLKPSLEQEAVASEHQYVTRRIRKKAANKIKVHELAEKKVHDANATAAVQLIVLTGGRSGN